MLQRLLVLVLALLTPAAATLAQPRNSSDNMVGLLARGWAALAKGDLQQASRLAGEALAADPRSAAGVALAVDVEIARSGSSGGLRTYEQWLGTRTLEEAYVLRQVARALLWEAVEKNQGSALATDALEALAADGDKAADTRLAERASNGGLVELAARASTGHEPSVEALIQRIETAPAAKVNLIKALGESGRARAVPVLLTLLSDRRDEHRAAAAEALGRLGGDPNRLKPLLADPNFTVRLKTAGALYRLEDPSGLALLQQMSSSEHAGVRLAAAEEMASHPDAAWLTLVRSLTQDGDPAVRLQAARMIAPHEPETATQVLDALGRDENPAIREEAGRLRVRVAVTDLSALRKMLSSSGSEQIAAADRILELTR